MLTNKEILQCKEQIFSHTDSYQVPFYNRTESKEEILKKERELQPGCAICISQPLGTGKTFFVNNLIALKKLPIEIGERLLTFEGLATNRRTLEAEKGGLLLVDEGDIKTAWPNLATGLKKLSEHIQNNNKRAVILGDYCLRNPELTKLLPDITYLERFEPLTTEFLTGALEARLSKFIPRIQRDIERGESFSFDLTELIQPELIDILTPEWMVHNNSFRRLFVFLHLLTKTLPYNDQQCCFTFDMAYKLVTQSYDDRLDQLSDDRQKRFLKALIEYVTEQHPRGRGIAGGFTDDTLYTVAVNAGLSFDSLEQFREVISEPLTRVEFLTSVGTPYYDYDLNKFVKRPGPYVPSLALLILTYQKGK